MYGISVSFPFSYDFFYFLFLIILVAIRVSNWDVIDWSMNYISQKGFNSFAKDLAFFSFSSSISKSTVHTSKASNLLYPIYLLQLLDGIVTKRNVRAVWCIKLLLCALFIKAWRYTKQSPSNFWRMMKFNAIIHFINHCVTPLNDGLRC